MGPGYFAVENCPEEVGGGFRPPDGVRCYVLCALGPMCLVPYALYPTPRWNAPLYNFLSCVPILGALMVLNQLETYEPRICNSSHGARDIA